MAEVALFVGDRKAPLRTAQRGGELPGQRSVHWTPAGQLGGILVTSEQRGQVHSLTCSGSAGITYPHAEQVLLDGWNRSITTRSRPYQAHLYSSCPRNWFQAASDIARARQWFLTMLRTDRSSITIAWFSRTSRVVSLCR